MARSMRRMSSPTKFVIMGGAERSEAVPTHQVLRIDITGRVFFKVEAAGAGGGGWAGGGGRRGGDDGSWAGEGDRCSG
jgi:hypothetical protein